MKYTRPQCWKLMSEIVRRKEDGVCFICGKRYWNEELGQNDWKLMDAGHFYHGKLDFDFMNIHCCCKRCNGYLHGNLGEYALKLIEKYGKTRVDLLRQRAYQDKPIKDFKPLYIRLKRRLANIAGLQSTA